MFYFLLILILPTRVYGIGQSHYECGENGRFEYCIDGIPGCVVGCHCHPGFYFDTDTKICEPNAKLVQEYRRLYAGAGPTRVPDVLLPINEVDFEPTPTTTTTSAANTQGGNGAKDTDDLGDWLYNQFFKTIENQVVNNTDSNDTEKPQTRRSNSEAVGRKKPKRRMLKKSKSYSKKGKKKKTDLRRKLLRITEDDSLFDSSNESDDDSSSDGSDSSSDSSSSSDISADGEKIDKPKKDDKAHGHRKVLVVNKKKRPPLPSFIFLPNLETPFFPPIGLAPPPMPMYPMVPIPPMPMAMPPMFPVPPPPPVKPPDTNAKADKCDQNNKPDQKDKPDHSEKPNQNDDKESKPNNVDDKENKPDTNNDDGKESKPDTKKEDKTETETKEQETPGIHKSKND